MTPDRPLLGRLPQPLACVLAVATAPVAQHLPAPRPATAHLGPAPSPPWHGVTSWTLRAERLVLHGFTFRGVVTVRTATGATRVLKFTARSVDAVGLDVTGGRDRARTRLRTGSATTSTFEGDRSGGGPLTFCVRRLSGTVAAIDGSSLPAGRATTITPDAVPAWLTAPAASARTVTFVGATASRFTQSGGSLSVTGLRLRVGAG